MKKAFVALTCSLVLVACADPTDSGPAAISEDAGPEEADVAAEADAAMEAGDAGDAGGRDAAPPVEPADCARVEVELTTGERFRAELIASYDHRFWWWGASDRTTVALFAAEDFAEGAADRSLRFVALDALTSMTSVEPAETCYRDFLRELGIAIARPPVEGTSWVLMGNSGYHRHEGGMGDFAWDLARTDLAGNRFVGAGLANSDYLVWDAVAVAPVSGRVVEVVDDAPDNAPGDHPAEAVNNLVGLHVGGAYYIYVLHLRRGSVPEGVRVGVDVEAGAMIGRVGNSGVTLEPHAHVVLLWYDAVTGRSWSVPVEFSDVALAPTPLGPFEAAAFARPQTGEWIRSAD